MYSLELHKSILLHLVSKGMGGGSGGESVMERESGGGIDGRE